MIVWDVAKLMTARGNVALTEALALGSREIHSSPAEDSCTTVQSLKSHLAKGIEQLTEGRAYARGEFERLNFFALVRGAGCCNANRWT